MKTKSLWIICSLLFLCFSFVQCKKNRPAKPKTELEKLPPITDIGANTFGCLLNGVVYKPKGGLLDNVFSVQYDPTYGQGSLRIKTEMIINADNYIRISIHGDSIKNVGEYKLSFQSKYSVFYSNSSKLCSFNTYDPPSPTIISGILIISKFDASNRIISGTFSFKISTPECGLVEATDGRFDVKY